MASRGADPRPRLPRRTLVQVVGVVAVVSVAEFVLLAFTPLGAQVYVSYPGVTYDTPPTVFCPELVSSVGPPLFLVERIGSLFRLSWTFGCEPSGNSTEGYFEIESVVSASWGFTVVSSTVPVFFGYGSFGYLNVTVRAPDLPFVSVLTLQMTGGPLPPP